MNKPIKLELTTEDKLRLDTLLVEVEDLLTKSSPALGLDFELWRKTIFGRVNINHFDLDRKQSYVL